MSNLAGVDIFELILAVSGYHEKFLFMYISEDDSEIKRGSSHCIDLRIMIAQEFGARKVATGPLVKADFHLTQNVARTTFSFVL